MKRMLSILAIALLSMANTCGGGEEKAAVSVEGNDGSKVNIGADGVKVEGNDLNDIECLENVGVPMCVADSPLAVQAASKVVLDRRGGDGAVRAAADLILQHRAGDVDVPGSTLLSG